MVNTIWASQKKKPLPEIQKEPNIQRRHIVYQEPVYSSPVKYQTIVEPSPVKLIRQRKVVEVLPQVESPLRKVYTTTNSPLGMYPQLMQSPSHKVLQRLDEIDSLMGSNQWTLKPQRITRQYL